ncbi:MAG: F0F1 ATP synthase subunit delta [Candidatus Liptonbacteria bacterium]|nr:F0F1 ATP synthase subunit delta [Candidatus Liptonbacteria bacterium]
MKYPPAYYAKAFCAAVADPVKARSAHGARHIDELVKNFARCIEKNGDEHNAPKILAATEKLLHATTGTKEVTFVTARPSPKPLRGAFHHLIHPHDTVHEVCDPSLVGGVKVVINDEEQYDGTLRGKIEKLFSF